MDKKIENLRKRVNCELINRGLTKKDLANALGVSQSYLGQAINFISNGDRAKEIRKQVYEYLEMEVTDDDLP
jgi:predicted transcriptional regulator